MSIKILDKLVGQFYTEVGPDLREEVLLDRGTIENALSRLAENLVDTARSGSLLGDGTSASTYHELVRNWYHQAQARSYEDETRFV